LVYTAIALNFMLLGIGRYIKGLPLGVWYGMLVWPIALFMNKFKEKMEWILQKKDITFLCIIWFTLLPKSVIQKPETYKLGSGRGITLSLTIYSLNTYVYY
jgi:hypothetical protein